MFKKIGFIFTCALLAQSAFSLNLPASIKMLDIKGGTFTMGSNSLFGSPDQKAAAPEHEVTLSDYVLSEAEITNAQYLAFLNAALADGLIEINTGTMGPDNGARMVQGTASSTYSGKTLYNLDGIRVLKDHDDADTDGDPFTGDVEPENPLNTSYIGYDDTKKEFYLKDPHNADDFDWQAICDYQDYGTQKGQRLPTILNDFNDWAGAGNKLSDELEGWTKGDPSKALNLPSKTDVADWPVTFVRWWGASAFVDYYGYALPTEAQWEHAAKGGQDFTFGVYDGTTVSDANWNQDELKVASHHVRTAVSGTANPFGCYNLAGNAWEWIADNYVAPYSTDAVTNPLIEENGSTKRCWRGGSWNYHEATLQSAMRFFDEEDRGNDHFGFRIAGKATSTGIDNKGSGLLEIYPNPANDFLNINAQNQRLIYALYQQDGRRVLDGNNTKIDVTTLQTGVYILMIKTDSAMRTQKVIISR